MGLLSKFMSALIGEPYTPKPVSQSAPKPVQQQTTQRRATAAQPRQTQQTRQLTQPAQSPQLAQSQYRAQTQTTAHCTSSTTNRSRSTTNRSRAQYRSNSQSTQKLMLQPMLPAEQIERARNIIGKIEKHELSDEQISAIAGAGHNTLVLAAKPLLSSAISHGC